MATVPPVDAAPAIGAAPEVGASPATPKVVFAIADDVTSSCTPAATRSTVRPIAAERYEVRFTATADTREKLRLAQDLLGHAVPSGDLAQVFDRALTVLIDELVRRRFAATPHPRGRRGQAKDSDYIPAQVRRT